MEHEAPTKHELYEKLAEQQKQRENLKSLTERESDAALYNTDGREFLLLIDGEKLSLMHLSKRNIGSFFALCLPSVIIASVFIFDLYFGIDYGIFEFGLVFLAGMILSFFLDTSFARKHVRFARPAIITTWYEFNRTQNRARIGPAKSFPLEQIVAINAVKKSKTRFLIVLELRDGTSISLGDWCFASKEFSWREDAAKIAEFLRVPLRIPAI